DLSAAGEYISFVDGLLLPGGIDINPLIIDEEPLPSVNLVSMDWDKFELALIDEAIKQKKPILGICRGMQLLNVALGGGIIGDIPTCIKNPISHVQDDSIPAEPTHSVAFNAGTILGGIFGSAALVNSFHHQAVKDLGPQLTAAATAPDGILEAAESTALKILAVQWHPEKLYLTNPKQNEIFKSFLKLC
ncbi:MAG: gamma-glutamyl-gamma-aminobutyrate hydrolase family protein, partial [Oscillospiraceae bacterium]